VSGFCRLSVYESDRYDGAYGTMTVTSELTSSPTALTASPEIAATDIAIVGRAIRVPGARTVAEFWRNLYDGVESIRRLTDAELRAAGVDASLLTDPNYIKAGAPLDGVELFDAGFFGFSPREAAIMDPQHRHFLEVAWEALEDAGHVPESFTGRIGVFGGSGMNAYMPYHLFTNPKLMASTGLFLVRHTGNDKDFLTTRVSYLFDLRGPSVNIQTACSTSLVAIHSACQSLIGQECDMALAGGVTIEMPHGQGYLYQEGEILSPDGHCRAFDKRSQGTIFGSGVGVVVLRRLEDALADGDTVYAVIKASAVNNDGGRKVGYLAPSVDGQAEAVAEALNLSGVPADTVTYIECHGTGTPVGDPIEVAGLTHAFRSLTNRRNFCALGSVKTNIGHLDTAAGVAGVVKVVEMLRHRTMVPNLHFREPNPEVDWPSSPFYVNDKTTSWSADGPLRAAVNSLGVGGTNAHIVVEEAPRQVSTPSATPGTVLVLSARSKGSLDRATARLADHLEQNPSLGLQDVAYTLATGRRRFAVRRAVVAASHEEAIASLRSGSPAKLLGAATTQVGTKVAFLFPGGGAQYPGMAADLYKSEPVFRSRVDSCLELLRVHENIDLRPLMFPAEGLEAAAAAELVRPSLALPALLTIELAVADQLRAWGITPAAMLGHSMGEYAAAYLAGVFTLRDVLAVVTCRGRLFETLPDGAMLSVPLPEAEVVPELLPGLSFAASTGPGLSLVSGEVAAINELEARFKARGVEVRRLQINVAAHSQMLDPILGQFEKYLRSLRLSEPTLPFLSNVTGTWIAPEEARDPGYWVRHLRQPVRFAEGVETLVADKNLPNVALLEVGPGRTLTSLAQANLKVGAGRTMVPSLRHIQDPVSDRHMLLTAVGRLWATGVEPNWKTILGTGRRRVSLPAYAFDHERHWIEPGNGFFMRTESSKTLEKHVDRAQWTYRPVWRARERDDARREPARKILVFEDRAGIGRELALELGAAGHAVVVVRQGNRFARINDATFEVRSDSRDDHASLLRDLGAAGLMPSQILHLWAVGDEAQTGQDRDGSQYFFPYVSLAQALLDEDPSGAIEVVVVTNGAEAAGNDAAPRYPLKSLAQGPVRVVPKEMPSVAWRSVDLGGVLGSAQAAARTLIAEVDTQTTDTRVALRGDDRFVETYERWPIAETNQSWPLRKQGVVVVTGGLGGIALSLAERLARASHARFVLVGRSAVPAREEWDGLIARLDPSDPLVVKIRGIQAIEAAGGEVLALSADVSDLSAMQNVVAQAEARFGAVHAGIHAAGVVDDAPLHGKERQSMEAVLRPKVAGAVALAEALRGKRLDFLALFSSSSAALGPAGQTDYVAANAFLNAYARQLTTEGIPARAVQWGAWREVGMAVAALGPAPLPGSEKVDHPLLQRRASGDNGATHFRANLDARAHWVLDEHRVRGAEPVLPGTGFVEMARAAVASASKVPAGAAIELWDVAFTSPLIVPEKTPKVVDTEVRREADGSVYLTISSTARRGPAVEHSNARGRIISDWTPRAIDVKAIEARCSARNESFEPGEQLLPQERLLGFGRRWKAVRSIAFGRAEALARLELAEAHAPDLDLFAMHPALLDMATGAAFSLIEGGGADGLFVPLSYGRIKIAQRLPKKLVSHVRVRPESRDGVGVLDATLTDEQGRVAAEIEGYVVKAVDPKVLTSGRKAETAASPLERWVEHGILPDEGFDLLGRVLGQSQEVQVLISPLDLHAMIAELRAPERPAVSAQPAAAASGSADANAGANAPRDEIEQKLAAVWTELLGVDRVGLQDAFFDLGGHSLIAVRLFARIRKMWGVDLPLATLFRAPTLETLAATIRDGLGLTLELPNTNGTTAPAATAAPAAKTGWTPLVLIRKGTSARPFFCVHGAGGNLLNFRDFAGRLKPDQTVYGLEARGVDGQSPTADTIEEMADLYLAAIRAAQPKGPYLLGGYSGGGVVALEIAHKLAQAGEQTAELVMLDTFHPHTAARKATYRDQFREYREQGLKYFLTIVGGIITRHTVWRYRNRRVAQIVKSGAPVPHELREWVVTTAFLGALRKYAPRTYAGKVTLFRAQDVGLMYEHVGPTRGWDAATLPNLDVIEIPGSHETLVYEPGVTVLATNLTNVLDRGSR
jgi:acyl transferase domain-containing protein/thioesterase domain-containing protein/acyl carrier protein